LRESQVQPLLLVFEDLHWIDSETQALLDNLVESLPTTPILLLLNYRPEYQHSWGNKTYYTQLRLDPLPPASADVFLKALLGDDSSLEPLKPLLIERTHGNPFFLEETVRTLVEINALVGEPGAYCLESQLPSIQVPDTVQAILAARIDRLPVDEKELLQTAAVIGTEVPLPLLELIVDRAQDTLHRGLAHLQAAEFLYETSLFPEREYTFKHALTHEVAYGSLLQDRRRVLHVRIVEALEALAGDRVLDHVESLAHHAFRGEVWDKAHIYYQQAATKAMSRSAYQEAVTCFEQALVALHQLPENRDTMEQEIDLRLELRNARFPIGMVDTILNDLTTAETLAETLDDQHRLGRVFLYKSIHFVLTPDYEQALVAGQRALATDTAGADIATRSLAEIYLSVAHYYQGNYHQAIGCNQRAIVTLDEGMRYERFGNPSYPSVLSRSFLVRSLAEVGQFDAAIITSEEGLRIAEAVHHPLSLMFMHWGFGMIYLRQGELPKALLHLERAVDICREADMPVYLNVLETSLGSAYMLGGRIEDAISLLESVMEQGARFGRKGGQSLWLSGLAAALLMAGCPDKASSLAQEALTFSRSDRERGHEAYILRIMGDIAMYHKSSGTDQAVTHYQQALTLADELGMRPLQAHCHRGLGTLYSQTGQAEQARAELSTAIDMYRDMEMTFWLPETEATLASVEGKT
jgi:tetratricopeptide (TPR) repeat protein